MKDKYILGWFFGTVAMAASNKISDPIVMGLVIFTILGAGQAIRHLWNPS